MLLGDADIEKAFREFLRKAGQSRAGRHSCRDRTNAVILLSECAKLLAEERRKILLLRGKRCACYAVKLGNAVVFLRILLTRGIASALLCHNMQQNRFFHFFRQCQELAHAFEVVSVHRTEIGKAHLLEQRGRQDSPLDLRLEARNRARDRSAARNAAESLLDAGFCTQILRADTQARQMAAKSADILGDRHIVVVEHHEQRLPRGAGAAQRLIRHAAGQRTVADDRDNVVFLVFNRACMRHAERHRNRIRGMSRDARVGDALLRLHKAAQTAVLAQRVKAVAPTGQDFVDIALMTYIVDDAVA